MDDRLIPRDISWLHFNRRVLQEAKDPTVPLLERVKFLAIYSSNLGEFFRVRVAQQRNLLRIEKKTKKALQLDPKSLLKKILSYVNKLQVEFNQVVDEVVIPELQRHNIYLKRRLDLNDEQREFIEDYFQKNMLPYVQPVLLVEDMIKPFLINASLYLTVQLKPTKDKRKLGTVYGITNIPSDELKRFVVLPSKSNERHVIMIDDIVRHSISMIFPGFDVIDSFSIKLTRDAELNIDDEFSGDLVEKIKESLMQRDIGPASRLVYDRKMPKDMLTYLQKVFELENFDLLPEGRYHNNFDYFQFPDFGLQHLKFKPLEPMPLLALESREDIYEAIKEQDHLLHLPYHTFESVIQFFEQASQDPNVTHIKIIQYRVGSTSRIMNALMQAVENGKQVSAFVEVKARFDEQANLSWGEKLTNAGVDVHYSFPGLKVHSKIALVRRIENGKPELYCYLSTGNFHEKTAKLYSDLGIFTADPKICVEVARIFSIIETISLPKFDFEHLLVGQFNLRKSLQSLVEQEIRNAQLGLPARIILKLNNLQDEEMIESLYRASQAGVKVDLIVRGICCLIPGKAGLSENIHAIGIIDRYLEHARVFVFHNNGEDKMYLSSADWMTRNLSYRIETTFPVYDKDIKKTIMDLIELQLKDNVKSRIIDKDGQNEYATSDSPLKIQSQVETYYYFKRKQDLWWQQKLEQEEAENEKELIN